MLLEGMHVPLTTPFALDGRLNLRKLEQNVAHYSLTPAAGIVVLGPTGEPHLLSDQETRDTLQTAIAAAAETKVMLAGIARQSVRGTLDLLEEAAVMRYDAALLASPKSLTEKELRLYLQTVADRAPLPLVLSGELPLELIAELSTHPQIIGLLASSTRPEHLRASFAQTAAVRRTVTVTSVFAAVTSRMKPAPDPAIITAASLTGGTAVLTAPPKTSIKTRTKTVSFQILTADTETMMSGLETGAVGAVPPFAAAAPQVCYEVVAAWKDGDPALAAEKQLRLIAATRIIERELGVTGIKYGCDLNGYFGGQPRLPTLPLTGRERAEIEVLMHGLKS